MCPPASIPSAVELDIYSTDETICKLLMQLQSGHTPPQNVLSDVDPYQYPPSNLPADMWYFSSGSKMDAKIGCWRSTGEACEIYSTSLIVGLRKTLQFYEGPAHDAQKTNWMMQEYTTTEIYTSKLDPRALYRVFLVDDSRSGGDHLSKSELVKNVDDVAGPSDVANQFSDQFLAGYVSEGDYLEIADLDIPLSRTTSSADSSCMTMSMTSEELFDSDALLREIGEDDIVDQEIQESRIKLNLSAPAKLKQVVVQPTALGSVDNVDESKPSTGETSKTDPTPEDKSTSNEVDASPPLSPPPSSSPPPASSSSQQAPPPPSSSSQQAPPSSSNSSEGSSKEEKKDHANRTKKRKMMKYLCFLAF
ncbi:hypothetical protein M8C21_020930 [Ambrosia artemisiifolia]|uniref:NAC domain-containing protein n=1 Tax=Ambrosia artemisiifolia TaxID=4212 RepID=A0AAD5BUI6_AMBAR|nr:hypothetical protein M8C21_020930 [Ambrosia artemisiifolia]